MKGFDVKKYYFLADNLNLDKWTFFFAFCFKNKSI